MKFLYILMLLFIGFLSGYYYYGEITLGSTLAIPFLCLNIGIVLYFLIEFLNNSEVSND